jgi:hypothetical protein
MWNFDEETLENFCLEDRQGIRGQNNVASSGHRLRGLEMD